MKTAAITRIHRSEEILGVWLSYHSRYFDDLVVFAGGYKGKGPSDFIELSKKYKFELIKVPEVYDMACHELVFAKQRELLVNHSWTLYSDADEIVVADPSKYDGLRHFMDVCREDQTFCVGYEVFQSKEEGPLDYNKPILEQRKYWAKDTTKSYSKPALSRIPTDWSEGFHYIKGKQHEIEEIKDTGLFLLHLKHVNPLFVFDFPSHETGTHDGGDSLEERKELIPERIRGIF